MASVYTNDLRLEEIGSGEQSGTWGDTTNTNLELIAEAFAFGTEAITTNADTHTTTIADGATDPGRSLFLKYTGTLDSACTITIGPNTVSKLWFIENGTSGSQNIIIKQGSGATITISAGQTKAIYSNGAGSGAAMVDAFASLSVVDLIVSDDLVVGDDLGVTGLVTIGETLAVTGVLTTTAATVFNGGFAANAGSTITTADNTNQLTLISTDADANVGPVLKLKRDSASPADNDVLGRIQWAGEDSAGNSSTFATIQVVATDVTNGAEDAKMVFAPVIADELLEALVLTGAGATFNSTITLKDTLSISSANASGFLQASSNILQFGTSSDDPVAFFANNAERARLDSAGTLFLGTTSPTLHSSVTGIVLDNGSLLNETARGASKSLTLAQNLAIDSGNTFAYLATDEGSYYQQFGGAHAFATSPSGSAGANATTIDRFVISNDGSLSTPTLGTSNVRFGVNAGNSIASGGNFNVCLGDEAGTALSTGDNNVAIGFRALQSEDGHGGNIAIGSDCLQNLDAGADAFNVAIGTNAANDLTEGKRNVIIGAIAGDQATTPDDSVIIGYNASGNAVMTGNANTCIGKDAGQELSSGHSNCFVGKDAGTATATGVHNVAIGVDALATNNDGDGQVAIGYEALKNSEPADGQTYNVAIGAQAGKGVTTGTGNVMIGGLTCQAALTGVSNVIIGQEAGNDLTIGRDNIAIGVQALDLEDVGSRNVAIGTNALGVSNQTGSTVQNVANIAIGFAAGNALSTGFHNTLMGTDCGQTIQDGARNTLYGKSVNVTASNVEDAIGLGNNIAVAANDFTFGKNGASATCDFDADAVFTHSSDLRLKTNIADAVLGLDFVNDLRPVTYKWKTAADLDANDAELAHLRLDKDSNPVDHEDFDGTLINCRNTELTMHGLIAQEVKTALDTAGVSRFKGWSEDQYGVQGISKEMYVIPLIKAVQELSTKLDAALARIATLEG